MQYLMYFLGLAAFFMSLFGFMLLFHRKLKTDPSFTPVMAVSTVSVAVYLVGFIDLAAASTAVYAVGIALFVWHAVLILRRKYSPKGFISSPGIIAFSLICLFFILRTRGMTVLHVDNFSHWATVIKDMCLTDAYPTIEGAVTFRNYTPGSAVFIYHVCRAVNFTESHALMAQGVMIASAVSALFYGFRLKRPLPCLAMLGITVSLLTAFELESASLGIYNLLVDGIIAYFAAAGGVIAFAYRRDLFRCAAVLTPVTVLLSLIKSSGQIFSFFIIILMFCLLFGEYFRRSGIRKKLTLSAVCLGAAGVNLLLPYFWNTYADRAFMGYQNKFPSDAGSLISRFTSKDPSYLKGIASAMSAELSELSSPTCRLLVTAFAVAAVTVVLSIIFKGKVRFMCGVTLCCAAVGIFYIAELFILYGFIFDPAEAEILASFYRYYSTVSLLLSAVLLTASVHALCRICRRTDNVLSVSAARGAAVILTAVLALFAVKDNLILLSHPYGRVEAAAVKERREYFSDFYGGVSQRVPSDSYLLVYTEKTDFFTTTLPQYELRTTHCLFLYSFMFGNDELVTERLSYPEYIIVESGWESFRSLMEGRGYTFTGGESDVYSLDKENMTLTAE